MQLPGSVAAGFKYLRYSEQVGRRWFELAEIKSTF